MRAGQELKNGAKVIAHRANGDRQFVLAQTFGFHPFVTWQCDEAGNTFWGHYFENQEEAMRDYLSRQT